MRLVVGVNHAAPFHVGGSEKVVQQITESMTSDFDMDCHVITRFANKSVTHNGVHVEPMKDDSQQFINQVNALKPDHFLVYSDSFHHWPTVVRQAEAFKCSKSVALVGMNHMRSREELFRLFRRKHEQFTVITHSDNYLDFKQCNSFDIPVRVIPNAIDMSEFEDHGFSFREKYKIPSSKKIILCVSNFFPGKGQEHLLHILKKLKNKGHDFVAVFICTPVNFRPAEVMRQRFSQQIKRAGFDYKILVSIPREDTTQAFLEADVFAFPSQIEVAPLVMLESMAAGLPLVAIAEFTTSSRTLSIRCFLIQRPERRRVKRALIASSQSLTGKRSRSNITKYSQHDSRKHHHSCLQLRSVH